MRRKILKKLGTYFNLNYYVKFEVKHSLTGAELMKNLNCSTLAVKSVNYEIENGYEELRSPSVTVDTDPLTERTYLEVRVLQPRIIIQLHS